MRFAFTIAFAMIVGAYSATSASAQEGNRLFFVKVTKATDLQGQFVDFTELKVTSTFGEGHYSNRKGRSDQNACGRR